MRATTQEILELLRGLSPEDRRRVADQVVCKVVVGSIDEDVGKTKTVFVSHDSSAEVPELGRRARKYRDDLLQEGDTRVFLSSDWDSIESGESWFSAIVGAIKCHDQFHAVVAREEAWNNRWMNFELGVAVGAGKKVTVVRKVVNKHGVVEWEVPPGSGTPLAKEAERPAACEERPSPEAGCTSEPRSYLAHVLFYVREAIRFKKILPDGELLRTSAEVHRNGEDQWPHRARAREICASSVQHFFAFIGSKKDGLSPWLNYEIGVAVGRNLLPRILVRGQIGFNEIEPPIGSVHLVGTGDHQRMRRHLVDCGLLPNDDQADKILEDELGPFFSQVNEKEEEEDVGKKKRENYPWPDPPSDLCDLDQLPVGS